MATKILPTFLPALQSWNLGWLHPKNSILLLRKCIPFHQSSKVLNPKKKGKTWSPGLVQHAQVFGARPPLKLNPMREGTETLATLFSQLYYHLEGEEIPIWDILELDIPLEFFFSGILPHTSKEVAKNHCPLTLPFRYKAVFPPPYHN